MLSLNAKLFETSDYSIIDQQTSLPPFVNEGWADFPRLWLQWIVAGSVSENSRELLHWNEGCL
jgi:hypothetical protein